MILKVELSQSFLHRNALWYNFYFFLSLTIFTSFSPVGISFISFLYIIVQVKANKMLSRNCVNRHLAFFSILGKRIQFSSSNIMVAIVFCFALYYFALLVMLFCFILFYFHYQHKKVLSGPTLLETFDNKSVLNFKMLIHCL